MQQANYPLVARHDFFKSNPGEGIFHVPLGKAGYNAQTNLMELPKVDVIVGNPPYVRQEKINEYYGTTYKKFLQNEAKQDAPDIELSGRSDILCYFFTHGGTFLKPEGYMGLLTSSNWLDTAYGFALQEYLLNNYEIVAIIESNCEPWFTGARVTTAATILKKQLDPIKRITNTVRFVWLKRPLEELLTYANSEHDRRLTFEDLRDRIMSLTADEETDSWRVRIYNQGELYKKGCLPIAFSEVEEDDEEDNGEIAIQPNVSKKLPGIEENKSGENSVKSAYIGYKWGIFLRAPNIVFKLLAKGDNHFVPLGQMAEVKFGLKSGCDKFFFPRDITDKSLAETTSNADFKERYGINRSETKDIRIILAGDGSSHLIEAKYLEPEVHGLMDISSVYLSNKMLDRFVIMLPTQIPSDDKYALKYIAWGEREKFNSGSTCQSRISTNRSWYDLTGRRRGEIIWPKLHQYRHITAYNPEGLTCNCNLYDIFTSIDINPKHLCALLNSTVVALMKFLFGSQMGREANQVTEIFDTKMMLIPDLHIAPINVKNRLEQAFNSICQRKTLPLVDVDSNSTSWTGELALEDRQQLDDAVLELLGITNSQERKQLRDELYSEMTALYRQFRVAERKMQRHRSTTARQGRASAQSIATEIWDNLETPFIYRTPLDFIIKGARTEKIDLPLGHAKIVKGNMFHSDSVQIGTTTFELGDIKRCEFIKKLCDIGVNGTITLPIQSEHCDKALKEYESYVIKTTEKFSALASTHTVDEVMQERVVKELWKKLRI